MFKRNEIKNVGDMPFLLIVRIKGHLDFIFPWNWNISHLFLFACQKWMLEGKTLRATKSDSVRVTSDRASDIFNIFTALDSNTRIPYLRNKSLNWALQLSPSISELSEMAYVL